MTFNYSDIDSDKLEFVPIGELSEIHSGERLFVDIGEHNIVIFNISGKLYAIADLCSHDDGPLGDGEFVSEYQISCPRHGARFDIRSGEAKTLPGTIDIPVYSVRVIEGQVEVGIPKETK